MRDSFRIVRARPEWAWRLSSIAIASKAAWAYPVDWLVSWQEALTLTPIDVKAQRTYAALNEAGIVGFYLLNVGQRRAELEHLWVLPRWRRNGIGTALMRHARREAEKAGCTSLRIEADPNAVAFYVKQQAYLDGEVDAPVAGAARRLPVLTCDLDGAPRLVETRKLPG